MESIRQFEYTINIKSPCSYIANEEKKTRNELVKCFTKKCYKGYYIIKILDILQISDARHIYSNSEGTFVIHVSFTALVKTYVTGDILPIVKICIKKQQAIGETDDVYNTFVQSSNNNILQDGLEIPVRVSDKIIYNTNK